MRRAIRAACFLALAPFLVGASPLPEGSLYDATYRWTDDTGARLELGSFRGRNVVLSMFYSDCTTTCALTLGKLREIEKGFEERGIAAEFVLVSYDSHFDTPDVLARFRKQHQLSSDRWHLLSGSPQSVRSLANRIGLGDYRELAEHIAHSFRILLLDENGVARRSLDPFHARVSSFFE